MVNAYKTTVQVGHLDLAYGRIKLEGWGVGGGGGSRVYYVGRNQIVTFRW